MQNSNIVIHIDETLDENRIRDLARELGSERGVVSACMHETQRHLMVVDFDPAAVRPSEIVESIRNRGLHAEMIGL